jgi:hypothetical protein
MRLVSGLALAQCQAHWIIPDSFRHSKRAPCTAPPNLREIHLRRGGRQGQVLAGQVHTQLPGELRALSEHQF